MSRRTVLALGIFFLASLIFYLGATREKREGLESLLKDLGSPALKEADLIELSKGNKVLSLKREGEGWVLISDFKKPAKKAIVEDLLETLAELKGEPRAQGKKHLSRFKLTEEEALHLVLKQGGKELAHFLVGKRGPQWESSFVRREGEVVVYLVPVNLLAKLEVWDENPKLPAEKALIDLQVLTLPVKEVKELSFEGKEGSWVLKREGEKFLLRKGKREETIDPKKAERFLRKLFPVLAEDVVPPQEFKKETSLLRYVLRNGKTGALYLSCGKKVCLIKKGPFVFRVKREALSPLFDPAKEFSG